MRGRRLCFSIAMILVNLYILTGCASDTVIVPKDILSKAEKARDNYNVYYLEKKMVYKEKGKKKEVYDSKEWNYKGIKTRTENISDDGKSTDYVVVNNGKFYMYTKKKNTVLISDILMHNNETEERAQSNFLDQYEYIKDMCRITSVKKEKVGKFSTYHLKLRPKKPQSIIPKADYWVEENSYMIIKEKSIDNDLAYETTVKKLKFNPKISSRLFKMTVPKNAKIQKIGLNRSNITLNKAVKYLRKDILYYPGKGKFHMEKVVCQKFEGMDESKYNISEEYYIGNVRVVSISVDVDKSKAIDNSIYKDIGMKRATIRRKKAWYGINESTRIIYWNERGISYSATIYDPEMTLSDFIYIADKMKYICQK